MKVKNVSPFTWILSITLVLLFILSWGSFLYVNHLGGDSAAWQMIVNGILLSIPLVLLYFSSGVLIIAIRQKREEGQITLRLAKLLYWSPRIAGIVIIFFVSLFALDVFAEGYSISEMLVGFFIHMLPSFALMIVLALAWRREWIGFVAFTGAAVFFLLLVLQNDPLEGLGTTLLFSAPLFVIALLFGVNWRWSEDIRPTGTGSS